MKKTIAFALALSIFAAAMPIQAAKPVGLKDIEQTAAEEKISAAIPELNGHNIIESKDFSINVTVTNAGSESKAYGITLLSDENQIAADSMSVEANTTITKNVKIKNAKQGPQNLRLIVKSGGKSVFSAEYNVSIIVPYKSQFMDWFSGRGLCGISDIYYWNLAGWQSPRAGWEWQQIEKKQGVYDFSEWKSEFAPFKKEGNKIVYLVCYNNPMYNGMTEWPGKQYGPNTKANFDAYAKYAAKAAAENPDIKYFELYNEPNIAFWKPDPNADDYTYLCEVTAREIKKVRPDAIVTVGVMAGASSSWTKKMYERNAFSSFDCISYHPYVYPSKADNALQNLISGIHDQILTEGGWKEGIVTEMGWPTHIGGTGISEEQQAIEFVKGYVLLEKNGVKVSQMYRMNDPGTNKTYNEDNFGMVRYDGTPKPAVTSVKEFNQRTAGGIYLGEMKLENSMTAHMYLKDQKLEVVAWNKAGAQNAADSFDFGTPVEAYDIYGNFIKKGNVIELGESPVYIEGLSTDLIAENFQFNIKSSIDNSKKQLSDLEAYDGYKKIVNMLEEENESLKLEKMPSAEEAADYLKNHMNIGTEAIEMYKAGELGSDIKNLTSVLFMIYLSGRPIMNMYLASINSETGYIPVNEQKVKNARTELVKKADDGTLSYSEAVLKFAEELEDDVKQVYSSKDKSRMKSGILKAWDETAGYIADWAVEAADAETKEYNDILLQIPSSEAEIETNIPKVFNISFYNYSPKTITGAIEIVSPSGKVIGSSEKITVEAGANDKIEINTIVEAVEEGDYKIRFNSDGNILKESKAPIKVKESIRAQMSLVETNFDGINSVAVDLKNLTNETLSLKVNIEAPEGWELSSKTQKITLDGNGSKKVSFGVNKKTASEFHFYAFDVSVENMTGKVIFKNKLPLTFTQIVKAESEYSVSNFDGNISDWSDSYPIYLGLPKDVTSYEDWQQSDVAARVLTKWDEKYLYLLVDVFDNAHMNGKSGALIWDGDCVQVSIDPSNSKDDTKYQTEDYEYGFAYTDTQGNVAYSWYAAGHTAGDEPSDYSKMIRDNTTKLSRYLIKLPQSALTPLKLKEGSEFGYNIAVNDADFTARERLIEYVPGTAADKAPSLYPTYVLTSKEKTDDMLKTCPIPTGMKQTSENDKETFSDIAGHWGEQMITDFAQKGYVSGVGDNKFDPDRQMTRAEFITMFTNFAGINESEQNVSMFSVEDEEIKAPKSYFDVDRTQWYAMSAYSAKQAGIISENIAQAYLYPDKPIEREEVCSVIDAYLSKNGDKSEHIKAIAGFSDSGDVSEWALKNVMNLYGLGIVRGDGSGKLNPKSPLTRAEAVAFLTAAAKVK